MKKHHPDHTEFEATYEVPELVRPLYAEIVTKASRTYPDHAESRNDMIRQELIKEWCKTHQLALDMGAIMNKQQGILERQAYDLAELKRDCRGRAPWWKFW